MPSRHIRPETGDDDDAEFFFNKEFVDRIEQTKTFEEAAASIQEWVKVLKHNVTEFSMDFPAVLERAVETREQNLKNPEALGAQNKTLLHLSLDAETESDYIVAFSLNFLEACSLNPNLSVMVSRIILNNLAIQINDEEIVLTKKH